MMQGQVFLHSSYCYVILYKYGPTMKNHIVYFWQGEQSSHDDRAASALQAYRLVTSFKQASYIVQKSLTYLFSELSKRCQLGEDPLVDFKLELNKEGSHHIFFSKTFVFFDKIYFCSNNDDLQNFWRNLGNCQRREKVFN